MHALETHPVEQRCHNLRQLSKRWKQIPTAAKPWPQTPAGTHVAPQSVMGLLHVSTCPANILHFRARKPKMNFTVQCIVECASQKGLVSTASQKDSGRVVDIKLRCASNMLHYTQQQCTSEVSVEWQIPRHFLPMIPATASIVCDFQECTLQNTMQKYIRQLVAKQ